MIEVCHVAVPDALVWGIAYALAVGLSGLVVRGLLHLGGQTIPPGQKNAGAVIGKLENVLIVTFVAAGAYTALAVIFAAKSLVRTDQPQTPGLGVKSSYYVLGTLANFSWSLIVALAARIVLGMGILPAQT